jgi:predicted amidohydrolase YtcJ
MLCSAIAAAQQATLAVMHARVWTGNPAEPWAEALAVNGDSVLAVGAAADIQKRIGPRTRVLDARGGMVAPGFIDSHVHFLAGGLNLTSVQLRDARSKAEFIARIQAYAANTPPGTWIVGGDWDHQNWGGELPSKDWIDAVTPRNPVWINRLDEHMSLANSLALAAAHIDKNTPDAPGGEIVRDASGNPTGILKDNAIVLIDRVKPPPSSEMLDRALDAAMQYVAARGVTSVGHMGTWDDLDVFRRARQAGPLRTRIRAAVPLPTWQRLADTIARDGRGDDYLQIGCLKAFVDGSLGSHTAALLDPYTDSPKDTGLLVNDPEDLYHWTSDATRAGLQVIVHAIGDRAIRLQLDIFDRVRTEAGQARPDPRFRIEHAQHIAPADLARFASIGVIASMQPYHAIDDGRWAEKEIGPERAKTSYAWRSLLDLHARLAFGSDWPVAPPTPLEGIYAAVTRRTLDGKNPGGWIPQQKISVEEALRAYTSDAAYAEFAEKRKGTLEPGKLADFVVLDRDLTRIPPPEIRNARVLATVVGGQVVFEAR